MKYLILCIFLFIGCCKIYRPPILRHDNQLLRMDWYIQQPDEFSRYIMNKTNSK